MQRVDATEAGGDGWGNRHEAMSVVGFRNAKLAKYAPVSVVVGWQGTIVLNNRVYCNGTISQWWLSLRGAGH
ncbi:hypothetical protein BJV74DRAFT_860485 [Russula compacta]|nr:hypothetical protein BJV74DRAFT_860485 [Russula compacta]